jgi:diguanylate cyclase (GGDEF)-like protein
MILKHMRRRKCSKGELLFREGDAGDELYVVLEGSVAISLHLPDGAELPISQVAAGSFFGEMSIIERAPRSATCRASSDSLLLSLHADDFRALVGVRPSLAAKVMQRMLTIAAGRLLDTGSLLSQMVQWGETARKRAVTDEATGLFNRRFLDDSLESLFSRSRLEGRPFSIAMFDLDHFGDINRAHGQAFGDHVIVEASKVFPKVFREGDYLVRYGGDEFTFVLPATSGTEAVELCTGVCRAIAAVRFPEQPEVRLSASLGVASYPEHAEALDALRAEADRALYSAKELGRGRAELARRER